LTYSVREEVVAAEEQAQEAANQIELKTAYEALVKKHGRKKVADNFSQLSKR
jgi:benzoyl-CoA reductase subunit BamC